MKIPIEKIKIKKRIRRQLGDLDPLMNSLRVNGQINPILINQNYELIAGHRRLASAKLLEWHSIEATVVEKTTELELLSLEIDENVYRADLTDEELHEAYRRMEKLRNPPLLKKIFNALLFFFKGLLKKLAYRQESSPRGQD